MTIKYERASELLRNEQKAMNCDETKRLYEAIDKLHRDAVGRIPFDW